MPDGTLSKGLAARIFRCKPDGSGVEVVCGGGMDNPVQVAFTEAGEPLASCNIVHAKPQRIDGILYALEGAVFPWHEALNEFKSTGELFEPVDPLGWVAVSGLIRYRGDAFGADYRDNLFTSQFNPHRVQRHIVERDGAGFGIRHEDFLTCTDPDFHPTATLEDADGSLLVIDTGGWFRIGCPTSRIAKPQISGAIYRIRRKGAPVIDDPRGMKIDWEHIPTPQLARLLDDPRPAVVDRAIDAISHRGDAIATLGVAHKSDSSINCRRNAVFALTRIDAPAARDPVRMALADSDASVRQVAAQSSGLLRDAFATASLIKLLGDNSLPVRRDAATALGRIREPAAVGPLVAALRGSSDRYLEHAIVFALIRIGDAKPLVAGLRDSDPSVRRGALLAMDQIDGSGLTPDQVVPLLDPAQPPLKSAALSVIARHPGWGDRARDYFRDAVRRTIDPSQREELGQQLAAFSDSDAIAELITDTLADANTAPETRRLLLQAMAQYPGRPLPHGWAKEIGTAIESDNEQVSREAVLCARSLGLPDFDSQLLKIALDPHRPESLRAEAFEAIAPRTAEAEKSIFELLIACLHSDRPLLLRAEAAEALGRSNLSESQLETLAGSASSAGPMELPRLLPAFGRRPSDSAGKVLLAALDHSPGLMSLRPDDLKAAIAMDSPAVQAMAEPLLKRLAPDAAQQKAHLAELAPALSDGDAERGRSLFFGSKAGCATCHTVAGRGGQVGPDLSKIGSIRAAPDLLESIVYPSASFARGYEPYMVRTKTGDVQAGIITRETADSIYLTTAPRQIVRIPRQSIDTLRPGTVSLMPQGFGEQLSREELADLIAFLMSMK